MPLRPTLRCLIVCLLTLALADAISSQWLGPDGQPLPFTTQAEMADFLRTGRVLSSKVLTSGSNRPLKVRLEKWGIEANAVFRSVEIKRAEVSLGGKTYKNFHDSYRHECAAYRLSLLLGLDSIPPCISRKIGGKTGTLQLWIEQARTEKMRRESGDKAPSGLDWTRQRQTMYLFDSLIHNFDRNQGNLLVTEDWKLWLIDHTRSFHHGKEAPGLSKLVWCERGVWQRLRNLDEDILRAQLGPLISRNRILGILDRRTQIVQHLEGRIAAEGETAVLFDGLRAVAGEGEGVPAIEDDMRADSTPIVLGADEG